MLRQRKNKRERIQEFLSKMQNNLLAYVRRQREKHKVVCVHFSSTYPHPCTKIQTHTSVCLLSALFSGSRGLVNSRLCGLMAYNYRAGHTWAKGKGGRLFPVQKTGRPGNSFLFSQRVYLNLIRFYLFSFTFSSKSSA